MFIHNLLLILALAALTAPVTAQAKLANGAPLQVELDKKIPREFVVITFPGGPAKVVKEKQGVSSVIASIMEEGPKNLSADQYRRSQFLTNSEIVPMFDKRAFSVVIKSPSDSLADTLALAFATITNPKLDQQTFIEAHKKTLVERTSDFGDLRTILFYYGFRDFTGYAPAVLDGAGSPKSIANINLAAIQSYYPKILDLSRAVFTASGPMSESEVRKTINSALKKFKIKSHKGFTPTTYDVAKFQKRKSIDITIIDKPGSKDNQVAYIFPEFVKQSTEDEIVARVSHQILGGGLTGRLGETLRTKRGLTYHAGSYVLAPFGWMVYTFGGNQEIAKLLTGVTEVVDKFTKESLKNLEIRLAAQSQKTRFRQQYELPLDRLMAKISEQMKGANPEYIDHIDGYLSGISEASVKKFVAKRISTKKGKLYLVGDAKVLKKALAKAGYNTKVLKITKIDNIL